MSQPDRLTALRQIRGVGFTEVRFDIDWDSIQPHNSHTYDWAQFDVVMQDVRSVGLHAVITLDRTPGWARPTGCQSSFFCAPARPDDFARFAAAAVARYRGNEVSAWEVWNEPNIVNFWKPQPNPNQYVQLLKVSYQAIKQQDPRATVLVGGLSGNAYNAAPSYIDARTFLDQLYTDGARNYFDGVAYHPYTSLQLPNSNNPGNGWPKMSITNTNLRSIMTAHGDQRKDIWVTEFGVSTNGPGAEVNRLPSVISPMTDHVSPTVQAQIAQQAFTDVKKLPWVKDLDWYTYSDSSARIGTADDHYGLFESDGQPKPVYFMWQRALK